MSIAERLYEIEKAIASHAKGRSVKLVAVSKYAKLPQMQEAYQAGVRNFGENRVQDALVKMGSFPPEQYPDLRWHLIGSLQGNKVKKTVGKFALIHSVDSLRLAEAISHANVAAQTCQDILLQINLSPDPTRNGLLPEELAAIVPSIVNLPGVRLRGLMGLAPPEVSLENDEPALHRIFSGLRDLNVQLARQFELERPDFPLLLSMGMSHDFVPALDCGATIIRLGNYLFKN